ncbi:hypothetical protein [Bacteroides sp.]|uniref:hypothetical protein n=1 Tax=Bacteroides sp. TaxID=29523 RepID=UPI003A90161E
MLQKAACPKLQHGYAYSLPDRRLFHAYPAVRQPGDRFIFGFIYMYNSKKTEGVFPDRMVS